MNIIWVAPPAAGKGTYCTMLKEKYGFIHISAGELLRSEVSLNTLIGKEIKDIVNNGEMIDDNLMAKLIEKKLKEIDMNIPFMLDGYPRKMNQVKDYEEILLSLGLEVDKVLFINIDKATGLNRILGRRNCPVCNKNYNLYGFPKPVIENTCDACNVKLISRTDDNKESYENRYETYTEETSEVINYYKTLGKLIEIDGTKDPIETFKVIEDLLGVKND